MKSGWLTGRGCSNKQSVVLTGVFFNDYVVHATCADRYKHYVAAVGSGIWQHKTEVKRTGRKSESSQTNNRTRGTMEYVKINAKKSCK